MRRLQLGAARWLLSCFALSGFTTAADADIVVYDNGAGGVAAIDSAIESDTNGPFRVADNVQFSVDTHVIRAAWVGAYGGLGPTETDDFTINIHADSGGLPGSILSSFTIGNGASRARTSFRATGLDVFEYSADTDYVFRGNVRYYFSVVNTTVDNDWGWGAVASNRTDLSFQSFTAGATWGNNSNSLLDFRLYAVPEPSTALMMAMVCFWCVRRFDRSRRIAPIVLAGD